MIKHTVRPLNFRDLAHIRNGLLWCCWVGHRASPYENVGKASVLLEGLTAARLALLTPAPTKIPSESVKEPVHVQVRTPKATEYPPVSSNARRVPTSTCYNLERYIPYRLMWAKCIVRAAYDYALWKDSKNLALRKFALDAERWLFEPSDLTLSFENICFAFDFPVERIRKHTKVMTKDDVKKLEFRERHGRTDPVEEVVSGDDS